MIVVSDTTILSSLFKIDRLDLLPSAFPKIVIPASVFEELKELESFGYDISVIANAAWISVQAASDRNMVLALSQSLDMGESEAIALAKEIGADLLLIDEKRGRLKAKEMGIPVIGLIGVVSRLKKIGKIHSVAPLLEELRSVGFWISDSLLRQVLDAEGE